MNHGAAGGETLYYDARNRRPERASAPSPGESVASPWVFRRYMYLTPCKGNSFIKGHHPVQGTEWTVLRAFKAFALSGRKMIYSS